MGARLLTWAVVFGDYAMFYLAIIPALFLRRPSLFTGDYLLQHAYSFTFIFPVWFLVNHILGLYDFQEVRELPDLISDCMLASFYSLLLSTGVFYLFPEHLMTPKTHLVLVLLFAYTGVILLRRLWVHLGSSGLLVQRIGILGDNSMIKDMVEDIGARRNTRYKIISSHVMMQLHSRNRATKTVAAATPSNFLKHHLDAIVVDAKQVESDVAFREAVISTAIDEDIPLWTHLDFYEELYKKIPPEHAAQPMWLLSHVLHRKNVVYLLCKRIGDTTLALLIFVLFSPLLACIAAAIRLFDGRQVLYSQLRLGYLGKEFRFWKFRTMIPGAENGGYLWNVSNRDPRVTRLGKFLRRYRLDELPQLWNIVRGDMSFVGPRPTWIGEKQALELPSYHLRHLVKPGLTGWAQINSRSTDSLEDTLEKLTFDLYYIKHISLSLDLAILLKTLKRVMQPEHHFNKRRISPKTT